MAVPFGFLGGMFQAERRKLFSWKNLYFCERTSWSFFWGLDIDVSNKVVAFGGRSREDISSEFRGVVERSGMMEGSDRIICISF